MFLDLSTVKHSEFVFLFSYYDILLLLFHIMISLLYVSFNSLG